MLGVEVDADKLTFGTGRGQEIQRAAVAAPEIAVGERFSQRASRCARTRSDPLHLDGRLRQHE
ncbi:MAG: hypothetical protein PVH89_13935 [Gammaproteobacteria bacterium]|jgi:hypothetical protein